MTKPERRQIRGTANDLVTAVALFRQGTLSEDGLCERVQTYAHDLDKLLAGDYDPKETRAERELHGVKGSC